MPESDTAEHEFQDGRRFEIIFPGYIAGVQHDAVAPHSTTAAHRTAPALARRPARGDPVVARPAGLGHCRATATAVEIAEQDI